MKDPLRGTGRTTNQLKAAPPNAVYVVQHQKEERYVRSLCEHLGRTDIRAAALPRDALPMLMSLAYNRQIVVDHAAHPTEQQQRTISSLNERNRLKTTPMNPDINETLQAQGTDPVARAAINQMLPQLLMVFIMRAGGKVEVPVQELDTATVGKRLSMQLDQVTRTFTFEVK